MISLDTWSGPAEAATKAVVTSSYIFHTSHAVFLPFVTKDDIVSHPLWAWNIEWDLDLSGPKDAAISCAGINL